jgi:predicted DCC family thiol-disulfide oxidoreductase YuxK
LAELELFYDGECRFCSREMAAIERLDRGRGLIAFVDITDPDFDAASVGRRYEDLMARIHARLPDGSWIQGMQAFRRAYRAVGLGWLLAPTGWPLLRPLFDVFYRWFARNRLWLGGRCEDDHCALPRQASGPAADD